MIQKAERKTCVTQRSGDQDGSVDGSERGTDDICTRPAKAILRRNVLIDMPPMAAKSRATPEWRRGEL